MRANLQIKKGGPGSGRKPEHRARAIKQKPVWVLGRFHTKRGDEYLRAVKVLPEKLVTGKYLPITEEYKQAYVARKRARTPAQAFEAYERMQIALDKVAPEHPERMHPHSIDSKGKVVEHRVGEKHKYGIAQEEHEKELSDYRRLYYGKTKEPWILKLGINYEPGVMVKIKGQKGYADKYSHSKIGDIYVMDVAGTAFGVICPNLGVYELYPKEKDAEKAVKDLFLTQMRKSTLENTNLFLHKQKVLGGISSLIVPQATERNVLFSRYQTGNNIVTLEGKDDSYVVRENEVPVISTNNIGDALSRYYHCIASLIKDQTEDKDIALDIFGEKVITNNRNIVSMLGELGKEEEMKLLKSMDYSALEYFFKDGTSINLFEKYEPVGNVFEIVSVQEEQGYGAAEGGKIPKRGDLTSEDYKSKTKEEEHQKEIEIEDKLGKNPINPAGEVTQKQQGMLPAPIEAQQDRYREVEKLTKVGHNHQQKLHPEEQRVIEQKAKMYFQPELGEKAPEGAQVYQGKRGGYYYETIGEEKPPASPAKKIEPKERTVEKPPEKKVTKIENPREYSWEDNVDNIENKLVDKDLQMDFEKFLRKYSKDDETANRALEYLVAWESASEGATFENESLLRSVYYYLIGDEQKMKKEIEGSYAEAWSREEEEYPELEAESIKDIKQLASPIIATTALSRKYLRERYGNILHLYRGGDPKNVNREGLLSYTLSQEAANKFARNFPGRGKVFKRDVLIDDIFLYLPVVNRSDRNLAERFDEEEEVVVMLRIEQKMGLEKALKLKAKILKDIDDIEQKSNLLQRMDDLIKADPTDHFFEILPLPEEMEQGAAETGIKRKFSKENEAMEFVHQLFDQKLAKVALQKSIDDIIIKSNLIDRIDNISKAKIYFQPEKGEKAPEGMQVKVGPKKGHYYESAEKSDLFSSNVRVRFRAAQTTDSRNLHHLIHDKESYVRWTVAERIDQEGLHQMMNDKDNGVRWRVAERIDQEGLHQMMNDKDENIRRAVAERIDQKGLHHLIHDESGYVCEAVAKRIDQEGLYQMMNDKDESARKVVVQRIDRKYFNEISEDAPEWVQGIIRHRKNKISALGNTLKIFEKEGKIDLNKLSEKTKAMIRDVDGIKIEASESIELWQELFLSTDFGLLHNDFGEQWLDSSNSELAGLMKNAVVEKFGGKIYHHNEVSEEVWDQYIKELYLIYPKDLVSKYIDLQYNLTQQLLEIKYPDAIHLDLYRGTTSDEIGKIGDEKEVIIHQNSLSSWTTKESVAKGFGNICLKSSIPKKDIFSCFLVFSHSGYEHEMMVIGKKALKGEIL